MTLISKKITNKLDGGDGSYQTVNNGQQSKLEQALHVCAPKHQCEFGRWFEGRVLIKSKTILIGCCQNSACNMFCTSSFFQGFLIACLMVLYELIKCNNLHSDKSPENIS